MSERIIAIDGEYLHILPSATGKTAARGVELSRNALRVARQAAQLRRCGRSSTICSALASPSTIAEMTGSQRWHSSPDSMRS